MLEERVKQLQNHVDWDFSCNKSLNRRLDTFRGKEASENEAAEKEVAEKEAAEEDEAEEENQQALPPGSGDDDDPIITIRFPRVKHWLKCPICLNYLYEHKNGLLFHIESFIKDEMSPLT
jgi:type IV secretory pathway VirB9-like protein